MFGRLPVVDWLVRNFRLHQPESFGQSLVTAVQAGHFRVARYLLQHGAEFPPAEILTGPLQSGFLQLARWLTLEVGVPITPSVVQIAASSPHPRTQSTLAYFLTTNVEPPFAELAVQIAMRSAVATGNLGLVRALLKLPSGTPARMDFLNGCAIYYAAAGNHPETVQLVLDTLHDQLTQDGHNHRQGVLAELCERSPMPPGARPDSGCLETLQGIRERLEEAEEELFFGHLALPGDAGADDAEDDDAPGGMRRPRGGRPGPRMLEPNDMPAFFRPHERDFGAVGGFHQFQQQQLQQQEEEEDVDMFNPPPLARHIQDHPDLVGTGGLDPMDVRMAPFVELNRLRWTRLQALWGSAEANLQQRLRAAVAEAAGDAGERWEPRHRQRQPMWAGARNFENEEEDNEEEEEEEEEGRPLFGRDREDGDDDDDDAAGGNREARVEQQRAVRRAQRQAAAGGGGGGGVRTLTTTEWCLLAVLAAANRESLDVLELLFTAGVNVDDWIKDFSLAQRSAILSALQQRLRREQAAEHFVKLVDSWAFLGFPVDVNRLVLGYLVGTEGRREKEYQAQMTSIIRKTLDD